MLRDRVDEAYCLLTINETNRPQTLHIFVGGERRVLHRVRPGSQTDESVTSLPGMEIRDAGVGTHPYPDRRMSQDMFLTTKRTRMGDPSSRLYE